MTGEWVKQCAVIQMRSVYSEHSLHPAIMGILFEKTKHMSSSHKMSRISQWLSYSKGDQGSPWTVAPRS
jgi:hypothetical protein